MVTQLFLLAVLVGAAIMAVFATDLLRGAVALALCSVALTLVVFKSAQLAAVFELSVCAGLITVLFINGISLTTPRTEEEAKQAVKTHYRKFALLPLLVAVCGFMLWVNVDRIVTGIPIAAVHDGQTVGQILWNTRGLDLIGQITIMLVGVYGVVVLFKRGKTNE